MVYTYLIKQLEEDSEHIWVSLVHLIKKHDGIWTLSQPGRQLTSLVIPHIPRRGSNQLCYLCMCMWEQQTSTDNTVGCRLSELQLTEYVG